MSEVEVIESEVPESGSVSVDDVLKAIQDKNLARAKAHFNDVMGAKVNGTLESEKVRMANVVFNGADEAEVDTEEDDLELESEVEDIFDDEEEEVED